MPLVLSAKWPWAVALAAEDSTPFNANMVRDKARQLAQQSFKDQDRSLPKELQDVGYDGYRAIRFRPERALWHGEGLPFEVQFFNRGFIFTDRVDIYEVSDGRARPIVYSPDLFDFGGLKLSPEAANAGFAGFRLHAPINRADYYDEVAVFLGASYFRAVAKGQIYGLSARGLSLQTGDPKGEEFPAFRAFWLEKPGKQTNSVVVHALLDSKSAAAAFRFTIRPGDTTTFDVEAAVYPRVEIAQIGIGSLTSMFLFDANDRVGIDDFRSAVHDSDGLALRNGRGEEVWRPLSNPRDLQISNFADVSPRGFGLIQRDRDFHGYEDLESRFEKRPSLWVEPIGDWGNGAVVLLEIPTKEEIHDNIVAFWRPGDPLRAKNEYTYTYRLHWGAGKPDPAALARFVKTRIGAGPDDGTRRVVLDVTGPNANGAASATPGATAAGSANAAETFRVEVTSGKAEIRNLTVASNPVTHGRRIAFELVTNKEPVVELRGQLVREDEPVSEVWIYRWTQ